MREVSECFKYEPELKKTTKATSFVASGRVIYIAKKTPDGKSNKIYCAFDFETKVLLGCHWEKDFLIDFISKQDLSCLGGQQSLF